MAKFEKDYAGFTNPELKDSNRIFTREDIKSMSPEEYFKNEKAIFYQNGKIGIPSGEDLQRSQGVVHVNAYTRSDGTYVRDYYRSWPEGHGDFDVLNGAYFPDDNTVPGSNGALGIVDGGVATGTLVGGISKTVGIGEAAGAGGLAGGIAALAGPIGIIALIGLLIYYAIKHPDKLKAFLNKYISVAKKILPYVIPFVEKEISSITGKELFKLPGMDKINEILNHHNSNKPNNNKMIGAKSSHSDNERLLQSYNDILKSLIHTARLSLNPQEIQLDKNLNELASTENQAKYTSLLDKYVSAKESLGKSKEFLNKLDHMASNHDYEHILNELGNSHAFANSNVSGNNSFVNNLIGINPAYGDTLHNNQPPQNQSGKEIHNNHAPSHYNTGQPLKGYISKIESAYNHMDPTYRQILNDSMLNPSTEDNAYGIHDIYDVKRGLYLNSGNDIATKLIKDWPLTGEFMRHAIEGLRDIQYTPNCKLVNDLDTRLKQIYKDIQKVQEIKGKLEITDNWQGIEYSSNSKVAQEIVRSPEFREYIRNHYKLGQRYSNNRDSFIFDRTQDLYYSLHNVAVLEIGIDKVGNLNVTIFDKYDFGLNDYYNNGLIGLLTILLNNFAWILQWSHNITNYYTIINVKISYQELMRILNNE